MEAKHQITLPTVRRAFTEDQRRAALCDWVTSKCSFVELFSTYGLPKTTLYRDIDLLKATLQITDKEVWNAFKKDTSNHRYLQETIDALIYPELGFKPLLPTCVERDIMASVFDKRDQAGHGLSVSEQGDQCRKFCETTAQSMIDDNNGEDTAESERYKKAKCCRNFIKDNFMNPSKYQLHECVGTANPKLSKNSDMSFKRAAAAADPTRSSTMTRMFKAHVNDLIRRGVFPPEGPEAANVEDWDEIGFDPWGRSHKVFSLFKTVNERRMNLRSGEHADFWATVLFGSIANGELTRPTVIHQGGSVDEFRGDFCLNLHPDFKVDCTPSGYCSKTSFRTAVETMCADGKAKLVYLDGHESHFDPVWIIYA